MSIPGYGISELYKADISKLLTHHIRLYIRLVLFTCPLTVCETNIYFPIMSLELEIINLNKFCSSSGWNFSLIPSQYKHHYQFDYHFYKYSATIFSINTLQGSFLHFFSLGFVIIHLLEFSCSLRTFIFCYLYFNLLRFDVVYCFP